MRWRDGVESCMEESNGRWRGGALGYHQGTSAEWGQVRERESQKSQMMYTVYWVAQDIL